MDTHGVDVVHPCHQEPRISQGRQTCTGTWATHGAADIQKSPAPPGGGDGGDVQVGLKDEESLDDEEHLELPLQ